VENKITKIVLTGGPCGGKTTSLAKLSEKLKELGIKAFFVPEIASLVNYLRLKAEACIVSNIFISKNIKFTRLVC